MKIIGLTEAKDKLSSVIEEAKNNPTIITKNGKTAAILIVPEDDLDLERLLLSRSQMLQDLLRERHEEIRRGETISPKTSPKTSNEMPFSRHKCHATPQPIIGCIFPIQLVKLLPAT